MKYLRRVVLALSLCLLSLTTAANPCFAATKIIFRYGLFEQSLPVSDLRKYADTEQASSDLKFFLRFLTPEQQKEFHQALQVKMALDLRALNKVLNTELAKQVLAGVSQGISRRDQAGVEALNAAVLLGASSKDGLGIISFFQAYPSDRLVVNVPAAFEVASKLNLSPTQIPPKDNLSASPLWQLQVEYQKFATEGKKFSACLFGDSVTAELGNTLGDDTFNFALNGLSSISLVEQLKLLAPAKIKCEKSVIAIGGNDAWYRLSDQLFSSKLQESISLVRNLGSKQIFLIPAFYSTPAASQDPTISATNSQIKQINFVISQVATKENIPLELQPVDSLNQNDALKANLSSEDGAHLNNEGINIYREALLNILKK
ncbi:alpha/beta hydrolase [Aetokthonos hydrillicola Thurmond2011]|jgi:lysophospholipase L1-like esterase|uniref:Alpha/beta hydrolase n=3 Tax=Aetokthonos TaxID=1550243 RepID=A0AAP5M9B8_9CYAN|nr:alpha/beta hydrolase [Aetokthonos hydrillicola]MBO3463473.1 alpha/beta hydrolase [Aetokthonos hydrillicola CCALA 1050]MBW4583728.1 alpha/beta hydrolase [Aetokthonos hydrillicola CCALA 1050]MDR9895577.1 alpha/beta hydrolase [Aetokthonos hydrillicola Thurmond2011]